MVGVGARVVAQGEGGDKKMREAQLSNPKVATSEFKRVFEGPRAVTSLANASTVARVVKRRRTILTRRKLR